MTTSRADLLEGVDMVGGESFCDSIYNFLKNQGKDINLFTNSGFGVWSRSDTNKGLAELIFDNGTAAPVVGEAIVGALATGKVIWVDVTNDDWAGGNGAGTAYLGAVTGTYIDNEVVNGSVAAVFQVAGDAGIGVKNDPMNDNSTAIWTTDAGLNLGFGAALYTVDTNAVNLDAWITAGATLEAGKIYKIELDIRDGTVAAKNIQGYFDDGAAQYGRSRTTAAGPAWVSVSWTFECATSTPAGKVGFRIIENLGGAGSNIQIRRFSCYEITPCCTEGNNIAFDGWDKADVTLDIYREHWGANTRDGSFYSLRVVNSGAGEELAFPTGVHSLGEWYAQFQQRPVTLGAWVKAGIADHCRVLIQDSAASTYSLYHTGSGDWEWLEVTRVIDASASQVIFKFQFTVAGDIDGSTIVYISQPMLVFGWSLGEGMYQPRLQEVIWLETMVTSNLLHNKTSLSNVAWADINLEADSDARLPKGAKAVLINTKINDFGSDAGADIRIQLRADATQIICYCNTISGIADDAVHRLTGFEILDANGDFDYRIEASAANTFDVIDFIYLGVQVN